MPVEWSARFKGDFGKLSSAEQDRVERILTILDATREHPSLHLKRLKRQVGYWEVRVSRDLRVILTIRSDLYVLVAMGRHDILETFKNN